MWQKLAETNFQKLLRRSFLSNIKLMRFFPVKLIFLLVAVPLFLAACLPRIGGGGQETVKEEYLKGKVVSGFPNVPLYPKSQVIESYGNKNSYGASFFVDEDLKKVLDFYRSSLASTGWEASEVKKAADNYVFEVKNKDYRGQVIVNAASDGKQTAITISVASR